VKTLRVELSRAVESTGLPGVVCAAAGPRGLLDAACCGHLDLSAEAPMSIDTVFWIASITKIATAVAVLQLVERGTIRFEDEVARFLPFFDKLKVLTNSGLVPAQARVIVRHLLTHTAGFGYEGWSRPLSDHVRQQDPPAAKPGTRASLERPLLFEPGALWNYGIGMDWAGLLIEEVSGMSLADYLEAHVFRPLGMRSTGFNPDATARQATLYARQRDGSLVRAASGPNPGREFDSGGAGLYSTPRDVLQLMQSILRAHEGSTNEVLSPAMVAQARCNQIGLLDVRDLPSGVPERSMDLSLFPGKQRKWSCFGLLHLEGQPGGRSAGSISWAGVANTFFWIDFESAITAVVFAQSLPFLDPAILPIVDLYERSLYTSLPARL
jgi:methyl acetate hydrolase